MIIQGIQSQILRSTVPMRMGSGIVKMLRISVDVSTFEWPGSLMRSILAGVAGNSPLQSLEQCCYITFY